MSYSHETLDPKLLKHRNSINEHSLLEKYEFEKFRAENVAKSTVNYLKKNYKPSPDCMKRYLFKRIPFLKWCFNYNIKENLLKDVIGGITIGIVNLPQGLAHSLVADQPAVNGLYVIFFASWVYFFLGTSRNVSLGTDNVVCLMIRSVVASYSGRLYPSDEVEYNDPNFISNDVTLAKQTIGTTLALLTGIIHLILALVHAGAASKFLSDVVVAAFTTGAAFHIVITQINPMLGVRLPPNQSLFKLINYFILLFKNITKTNIATMIISIISMIILFVVKQFINRRYAKKLIAPVPIELVVIIFTTLFSYLFEFNERWNVSIVGDIPSGFPTPTLPPANLFSVLFGDALSIAVVSFAVNLSMTKLYAKQFNYSIEGNQELVAYGAANLVCSVFSGFPICVGLSRSAILVGTKSMTLMYTVLSNTILMVIILAVGSLLRDLPHCVLAAIIAIALVWMLLEVKQIVPIYKRSKTEAMAWLATFGGVVILDIDYGLYIGLGASILLVILQSQRATTSVLGNIPHTDIYECATTCKDAMEIEGIKIIRFEASLYYANVESFNYKVSKMAGVKLDELLPAIKKAEQQYQENSRKIKTRHQKLEKQAKKNGTKSLNDDLPPTIDTNMESEERQNELAYKIALESIYASVSIKDIILDCSSINQVDSMGVDAIAKMKSRYEQAGVHLHLTCCKRSIMRMFGKVNFKEKFDYAKIYPTTHDAVLRIIGGRKRALAHTKTDDVVITFMNQAENAGFSLSEEGDFTEKIDVSEMYVEKPKEFDALDEITRHVISDHYKEDEDNKVTIF